MQPGCPIGIRGGTPRYALVLQWGPGVIWDEFWVIFEGPTGFQLNLDPAGQRIPKKTPKVLTARRIGFHEASQRASSGPRPSFYAENVVHSNVLARSQYCSFGVKNRPGLVFDSLGPLWGHFGVQVSSQSPFEKLSKKHRNFDDS